MEIEIGEYVRVKEWNVIGKILKITASRIYIDSLGFGLTREQIHKHSKNIIDLIEVGDYVNGYIVEDDIEGNLRIYINSTYPSKWAYIESIKIKSIVTKEQMASIEYKAEENK